ncbi:MAG: M4 family metallopeptidase [Saprospiraceae bacterium]|nr:M4 family metallopeptidase [Saprospiraceae bacterium]
MYRIILPALLFCLIGFTTAQAQSAKIRPPKADPNGVTEPHGLVPLDRPAVPSAPNPFGVSRPNYKPMAAPSPDAAGVQVTRADNGLPIFFQGTTPASGSANDLRPAGERALEYLASLPVDGMDNPAKEFVVKSVTTDEQGNQHVRLQQVFQGVPVYGGEMIAHTKNGAFESLNGRYYPTLRIGTTPALSAQDALLAVTNHIGPGKVKTDWTAEELQNMGGAAFSTELVIYHPKRALDVAQLAWVVEGHPNFLNRVVYFIDAQTGAVLHHYDHTCNLLPGHLHPSPRQEDTPPPVTGNGVDLLNVNRSFGAWQSGGTIYLEDASKPMFNSAQSQMPGSPVGAIVTLTGFNTSPQNSNFDYGIVTSNSTTFNNPTAVSAHYNAGKSYDYYKNTFNRNSIDGVGGNIVSFINISEPDGSSMENAFWNGDYMFYGNGGSFFKPLARGLDVAGHEMTHGVVEKTANLEYQDESGALNESFADVFGAMIDRDDWKIGEDVMQSGVSPSGALRDLSNPHNGANSSSPFWQPNHVSEQYNGPDDNGGVHINSGIPNRAFYLFASNANVGKDKAEQVYYKALRDYLVKSSQFVDARIAVIQAANDLYGSSVAGVAASSFSAVGIEGSTPGGNYLGDLEVNPGLDFVLCATNDFVNLQLADGDANVLGTMYNGGLQSRPSVSDNGTTVVFVNDEGHIILLDISYAGGQINFQQTTLSQQPEWRNVAISKDGRFLAALTSFANDRIYIYDLFFNENETFFLYNPTYTQGQITGEVTYADVLEFDYSGEYLMYDAFNELVSITGEDLSYWDIGFIEFYDQSNQLFNDGGNAFISKLFSGLPENTSVGNPTFSKNSPYIIAFDYIDDYEDKYYILGANVETGDYDVIVPDNGDLGWPSYTRLDDAILYQKPGYDLYIQELEGNKISPFSNTYPFLYNRQWGVWFSNGARSLIVDADEPGARAMALTAVPNPASDAVQLRFQINGAASTARVRLTNMLGATVIDQTFAVNIGENQITLNLQSLPAGNYVAQIGIGAEIAVVKIVKQ